MIKMESMLAQISSAIEEPWLSIEPVRVGSIPPGVGTPDVYVTVMKGDEPVFMIDVYGDPGEETFCFSDAVVWVDWVVVGFGHRLYLVRLSDRSTVTFNLHDYFGHLYVEEDRLLVASASRLFCFTPEGSLLWTSDVLGLDGVVVTDIGSETITGEGEWDPPGGWLSFTINARNGKTIGPI